MIFESSYSNYRDERKVNGKLYAKVDLHTTRAGFFGLKKTMVTVDVVASDHESLGSIEYTWFDVKNNHCVNWREVNALRDGILIND